MKINPGSTAAFLILTLWLPAVAQEKTTIKPGGDGDVSLKLEIQRSIDKGIQFLVSQQNQKTGAWSDPNQPAFTALAVSAIMGDPSRKPAEPMPSAIGRGYGFITSKVQRDGGIYGKGLATYNTSLCVMALVQSGNSRYFPVIAKARRLLINQQQDYDKRAVTDNVFDGGIGYGGSSPHSDLSNTHLAMEALYYSKKLLADTEFDESGEFDLDWDAAIDFVSRCQNSKETVRENGDWQGLRKEDEGGFVYYPGDSKAGEIEIASADGTKKTALRSYGSISYAGLLAFIYADMDLDDPRVQSALHWIQGNFTLDENPGMDAQGLYYYYHTMAKALSLARVQRLKTPNGKVINWRESLALKIMSQQNRDGSWVNQGSNRWMEDNPVLVSAYSLLSLEHIIRGL